MANPIFSATEGWPNYPTRSYGRIDQTEPVAVSGAPEAVFAFDVVDADWDLLGPGRYFDLGDPLGVAARQQKFWSGMASNPPGSRPPDPFDRAPIYRIEITTRPGDRFYDALTKLTEEDWVRIVLGPQGDFEVDVYGGLFVAAFPNPVFLQDIAVVPGLAAALSAGFDMDTWPDATEGQIKGVLSGLPEVEYLAAYDVGQGSANALLDGLEDAVLYFDLGCGVYGNRHTKPTPLRFCWRARPAPGVVLSHWDSDHWAGEANDPGAHARTWLAPRQKISMKHAAFASKVLGAGGAVLIWGSAPTQLSIPIGARLIRLARCNGPPSSRNDSGISCLIEDIAIPEAWLLTGDSGYHNLNQVIPTHVSAVVAPHHGATMPAKSVPPARPGGYGRVMYSFGAGNKHGKTRVQHPTAAGVGVHSSNGWGHGAWSPIAPGGVVAGGDALATAQHPGTHLDGAVVGWSAAPPVPFKTVPCSTLHGGTLCTSKLVQS